MLKPILLGLAAIAVLLLIIIALQPSDFRIVRSARFSAPASALFSQVNDLHRFNGWSPWANLDSNARYTFEGPASGPGSSLAWAGNNQVGEGKMTITEARPDELILMRLEFFKPFTATNETEFTFKPDGNQTAVTWSMSGTNNFIGKAMSLVMNCDKMCGEQFEQGFANLRAVVEQQAALTTSR